MPDSYQTVNGVSALNTVAVNEVPVKGELLPNDIITGFRPLLLGASVGAGIAQHTLIADARMVGLQATADGRLLTLDGGPPSDRLLNTPVVAANDTSSHALLSAKATGIKNSLWGLEICNLAATATSVQLSCPSLGLLKQIYIPASSGKTVVWKTPAQTGAAEALNYQLTTAVGASVLIFSPDGFITKD